MALVITVPLHSLLKDFPNLSVTGLNLSLHPTLLKMLDINQIKIPKPEQQCQCLLFNQAVRMSTEHAS